MKKIFKKSLIYLLAVTLVISTWLLVGVINAPKVQAIASDIVSSECFSMVMGPPNCDKVTGLPNDEYVTYQNIGDNIQVHNFDTTGKSGTIYQVLVKIKAYADSSYLDDTLRLGTYSDPTTLIQEYSLGSDLTTTPDNYTVDITSTYPSGWSWDNVKNLQLRTTFQNVGSIDGTNIFEDAIRFEVRTDDSNPVVNIFKPVAGDMFTGGSTAKIMWSASDPDTWIKYDGIKIEYSINGGSTWNLVASGINNNTSGQMYDWAIPTGVNSNQVKVRVTAEDGTGHTNFATSESFAIYNVLTAPTNLIAVARDGEISLSWNAVIGASYYNVYYQKFSDSAYTGPVSVNQTSTKITGLKNGENYRFIVRAVTSNGIESANAWLEASPVASKVVLASAPKVITTTTVPSTQAAPKATEQSITPPTPTDDQGKIKGEEATETTSTDEPFNWMPWIILIIIIILAGAATGGYFYWTRGEDEEEKPLAQVAVRKSKDKDLSPKKGAGAKKNNRW